MPTDEVQANQDDWYRRMNAMYAIEKPIVHKFGEELKLLLKKYGFELTGKADDWALLQVVTKNELVFDIIQVNDGSADFVGWL